MSSLLEVNGLTKYFPVKTGLFGRVVGYVRAVDGVSFEVAEGTVFALVGESGSGKTTTLRCILKLTDPTSGEIRVDGRDVTRLKGKELKWFRRNVQAVFQNPYLSLNPRMRVKDLIAEPLKTHTEMSKEEIYRRVAEVLALVGLPEAVANQHPPSLSGGQAQRVAIARALSIEPKLLLLDEPTSALDVSVQAQILNLLVELKEKLKLTYLLVTHDLSVVRYMSDYVAVMYLGKIMEVGTSDEIFSEPGHPYTLALLSSIPEPDPRIKKLKKKIMLSGEPPSPMNPPSGCRLSNRCPYAIKECVAEEPELTKVTKTHYVRCIRHESLSSL
ncbi:MAG: ABC transporter ATP-binding protein, partial [Zestosphaera sp.]